MEKQHNRRRKRTQNQQRRWHVAWLRAVSIPARLPGGQISLSFFYGCTALPHGGPFLHTARPSFLGELLHMSCGSAGSHFGGKLQIKCGLSQRLGCSLCACSPPLATSWPTDTKSGPGEAETGWLFPGGLSQAKGKGLGQGATLLGHLFGEAWDVGRVFAEKTGHWAGWCGG